MSELPLSTISKQDAQTPGWLFQELLKRWPFTLDAAAAPHNALCSKFYTEETNGLAEDHPWDPFTFCNPPYKKILPWIDKAAAEAYARGCTSVLLLPARLESSWYVNFYRYCETEIITPRVPYVGYEGKAPPHGSMLLIFTPETVRNPSPEGVIRSRLVTYKRPKG